MYIILTGAALVFFGSFFVKSKSVPEWLSFLGSFVWPIWMFFEAFFEFKNSPVACSIVLIGYAAVMTGLILLVV